MKDGYLLKGKKKMGNPKIEEAYHKIISILESSKIYFFLLKLLHNKAS